MNCDYCDNNKELKHKAAGIWLCQECFDLPLKKFEVQVVWQEMGTYECLALSEAEAEQKAIDDPLPNNGSYVDNSFEIDGIYEKKIRGEKEAQMFNAQGTQTGRFPCDKPNLANRPRGAEDDPVEPTR